MTGNCKHIAAKEKELKKYLDKWRVKRPFTFKWGDKIIVYFNMMGIL